MENHYDNRREARIRQRLQGEEKEGGNAAGFNAAMESAAHGDRLGRFNARQGHGYAAEQVNDLIDKLSGKDARILGDDNAKNGPDRMVDGQLIQTKYCANAQATVDAAFRNGKYRYLDAQGKPMQLEVPSDQYQASIRCMEKKIAEGQVAGVDDPSAARKFVRKGNVDYKTACNIARAGTVESLSFDAAHGMVVARSSMGISAILSFAKAIWAGEDVEKAVDIAMYNGLQMGGMAFAASMLTSQLTRTGLNHALLNPSIGVVRLLPSSVRKSLLDSMHKGAAVYGGAATKDLAKLLRSNAIAAGAMLLAMSAGDITNCFRGRISAKQLFKNMTNLAGGIGGGYLGTFLVQGVASAASGGAATAIVLGAGIVGGTLGTAATSKVTNHFVEEDAREMVRILDERLIPLAQQYLLSQEELDLVVEDLNVALGGGKKKGIGGEKLLEMYASSDRAQFADTLLTEHIENIVRWRVHVRLPKPEQFMEGMGRVLTSAAGGQRGQNSCAQKEWKPVEMGRRLLGREVSERAANKAWYVTKQMNIISAQQGESLAQMAAEEKEFAAKQHLHDEKIAAYRAELKKFGEENEDGK